MDPQRVEDAMFVIPTDSGLIEHYYHWKLRASILHDLHYVFVRSHRQHRHEFNTLRM